MSLQFDSLHDGLEALRRDLDSYDESVRRFVTATAEHFAALDRVDAELRDDLHAVANRVETLTRSAFACTPDESGGLRDASN